MDVEEVDRERVVVSVPLVLEEGHLEGLGEPLELGLPLGDRDGE